MKIKHQFELIFESSSLFLLLLLFISISTVGARHDEQYCQTHKFTERANMRENFKLMNAQSEIAKVIIITIRARRRTIRTLLNLYIINSRIS